MRAPVQGARIAVCGRVRKKGEEKRGDRSDYAVGDGRKQFYSSAVRGRMETQSAGSFQLRWQPLGDSMGIAPKLQGRGRARSSSTWWFSFGTLSILGNEFTNPLNP